MTGEGVYGLRRPLCVDAAFVYRSRDDRKRWQRKPPQSKYDDAVIVLLSSILPANQADRSRLQASARASTHRKAAGLTAQAHPTR